MMRTAKLRKCAEARHAALEEKAAAVRMKEEAAALRAIEEAAARREAEEAAARKAAEEEAARKAAESAEAAKTAARRAAEAAASRAKEDAALKAEWDASRAKAAPRSYGPAPPARLSTAKTRDLARRQNATSDRIVVAQSAVEHRPGDLPTDTDHTPIARGHDYAVSAPPIVPLIECERGHDMVRAAVSAGRLGESLIDVPPSLGARYQIPAAGRNVNISISSTAPLLSSSGGGSSGITGGINLCTGVQVFDSVDGDRLAFRTLTAGAGISIIQDAPADGCIEILAGSGGGPPLDLELYVSAAGNDATGDGSAALPFATIERAIFQVRSQGWDRTATINIVPTAQPFVLSKGTINLDPGSLGAQQYPLVIQGGARTAIGTGTINTVLIDSTTPLTPLAGQGSNLLTLDVTTPIAGAALGQIVRFTSGALSAYTALTESTGTQQVEAFIGGIAINGNPAGSLTLTWATTPLGAAVFAPAPGDSFVVEALSTTLQLVAGTTTLATNGARVLLYNLAFASMAGPAVLSFANTALEINACGFESTFQSQMTVDFAGGSLVGSTTLTQTYPPFSSLSPPISPLLPALPPSAPCSTASLSLTTAQLASSTLSFYPPATASGLNFTGYGSSSICGILMFGDVQLWGASTMIGAFASTTLPFVFGGRFGPSFQVQNNAQCGLRCAWFEGSPATSISTAGRIDATFFHSSGVLTRLQALANAPGAVMNISSAIIEKYASATLNSTVIQYAGSTSGVLANLSVLGAQPVISTQVAVLFAGTALTLTTVTVSNCTRALSTTGGLVNVAGLTVTSCTSGAINLTNTNATLSNVTLTGNSGASPLAVSDGSVVSAQNLTVGTVSTGNSGGAGVSLIGGSRFICTGAVNIVNNPGCLTLTQSSFIATGPAVTMSSSGGAVAINLLARSFASIIDATISTTAGSIIQAQNGSDVEIQSSSLTSTAAATPIIISVGSSLTAISTNITNQVAAHPAIQILDSKAVLNGGTITGVVGAGATGDGIVATRSALDLVGTAINSNGGNGITLTNANATLSSVTTAVANGGNGLQLNSGSNVSANGASTTLLGATAPVQLAVLNQVTGAATYTAVTWNTLVVGGGSAAGNTYATTPSPNNSWSVG